MRPSALEITASDFALAVGHRRIAISPVAGTLNSAAAFSIAAASSGASIVAHREKTASIRSSAPTSDQLFDDREQFKEENQCRLVGLTT
jgi:hypothetical protein